MRCSAIVDVLDKIDVNYTHINLRVIMNNDYMHDKIKNWARWCLQGKGQGHCRSIEHRYEAESDFCRDTEARLFTDILDAAKVEECISHPNFPKKYRQLIISEYIKRKQYQQTCREFGIRYKLYDSELEKAVNILDNRLHKNPLTLNPVNINMLAEDKRPAIGHGYNSHLYGELATA